VLKVGGLDVRATQLPEVLLLTPAVHRDERGYFFETWRGDQFAALGLAGAFVQDNHSHSRKNVLRGLHYQIVQPQGKLVRVAYGSVYVAAVDLRRSSPRFGHWAGAMLDDDRHQMLWVPPGFAHGYLTLSERADFLYKCTDYYSPQHERAVRWNDAGIGIRWPLPSGVSPLLSGRDAAARSLTEADTFE
jgi:dTDP-4-dehydrorhamnose 3,5-epimerase